MRLETIALVMIALTVYTSTVHGVMVVGRNIDIAGETTPDRQRVEPTIAVDPHNASVIVAGAQDLRLIPQGGHRWHGYYRSVDGGKTWSSSLLPGFPSDTSPAGMASPLQGFQLTTDPVLVFDRAGNVYYAGIAINFSTATFVAFVAKFVNDGADYSGVMIIGGTKFADKPWITVDTTGGPRDGSIYLTFDAALDHGGVGVVFTRSSDGGKTFSQPTLASTGGLPGITVDPSGNIFVSSVVEKISTSLADILVTKSADGGLSFQKSVTAVADVTRMPTSLPGNGFRTGTVPQIASDGVGVYLVWGDFGTGDSDVLSVRSLDGGATWSKPNRVNDVATGQQFFPSIAVSAGIISVIWYDSRLGQLSNGTITGLDVFYAKSTDSGASFSPSLRVTRVSFNPNLVERTDFGNTKTFMGDYIQVAASAGIVHPIWTDNRNACDTIDPTFGCVDQDAFTATITITS